jgi:hypothetical protein
MQMRIVQIADALLRHGTISGVELVEVMDETDPGLITAAEFNCWSGRAGVADETDGGRLGACHCCSQKPSQHHRAWSYVARGFKVAEI